MENEIYSLQWYAAALFWLQWMVAGVYWIVKHIKD